MPTFTDMEAAAPQAEENQPASQETTPVETQETVGDPFDELLKASEAADPFATPAAIVPTPVEATNLTPTLALALDCLRS